jgi:putative redox protein
MQYTVDAVHQRAMEFVITAGHHAVTTDYPLQLNEEGVGPRPLELLLGSLASCAGGSMVALLKRARQSPAGLQVIARGDRRSEHPTVFTQISLEFVVRGSVDPVAVARAVEQSEALVCPVWAMLKAGTPITSSFRIES